MRTTSLAIIVSSGCLLLWPGVAPAAQFKFASQTLTVPDGFEVELVAAPPLVDRPVSADFDEQGRLYVTDSSGSNDKPDKQLEEKPHRVVRLEDSDGDGKFDKSVVFADRMMFPEGCLWFDGSIYVSAPPSIWKLTDTNNDGVADVRSEWHLGKTLTGCANDLHGPYLGPDGWIYWCKGAFAEQKYDRPGKTPFVSRAAHIFRTRPDHTGLEPVLTGGMDNPVGLAFTRGGERIMCGTFFDLHTPGHRDGIIHAIYGGVYGKINNVTDDHKKTGDLMPVMTHMGPAAPCSVIRYESRIFGNDYQDNLFVCAFNFHKVTRHQLEPDGATFKTKDTDFLSSDNPDFHPTYVLEDADGSMLVLDTGGWYKICCPTAQLAKPDILGAIYRVRRTGARKVADPRGLKLAWDRMKSSELAKLLGEDRPFVARRAMAQLAEVGPVALHPVTQLLKKSDSDSARVNAVWTLTRIDSPEARAAIRAACDDNDQAVRYAALHSISLWRDGKAKRQLYAALKSSDPQMQRVAAEALGRIGEAGSVPYLLGLVSEKTDRSLQHSLTYALIEIANSPETAKGVESANPLVQNVALMALDQMDNCTLKPAIVSPFLSSKTATLRQTAMWVARHHPDWGDELADFFKARLARENLSAEDQTELQQQLAAFAQSPAIQDLIASRANDPHEPCSTRQVLLASMSQAGLKKVPPQWPSSVTACLNQNDEGLQRAAVTTARSLSQVKTNTPDFSEALLQIGYAESHPAELRLEALAALPNGLQSVQPKLFKFLCSNVDSAQPVSTRSATVSVLTKANLTDEQLNQLADRLKAAGPLEVTRLLAAFERSTDETLGLKLVSSLKESKGLSSLRPDLVKTLVSKYPQPVKEQANELINLLNADAEKQNARIDELLADIKNGDIRRGQIVFNSQKTACATCHTLGYMGGHVGPDLTSIGQARTERDLLESVVYPSASFVRSYEPYIVTTKSEETYNGVLKKDAPDEVVLATGANMEVHIARSDIVEMRPGTVSIMPGGLADQISKQELLDLVAFLKGAKWGPR